MSDITVIEKLLLIRRRQNLTVKQAARRWGLKWRTLSSWEQTGSQRRKPSPASEKRLQAIAEAEERKLKSV